MPNNHINPNLPNSVVETYQQFWFYVDNSLFYNTLGKSGYTKWLYGKRDHKLNMKKLWQSIKEGQMKSLRVNLLVLIAIDSLNYWVLYLSVTFMMDSYWYPEKGAIRMLTGGILAYFITLFVIIRTYHFEIKFTEDLLQIVRYDRGEISIKIADIRSIKFVEHDEVLFGNQCEFTLLLENKKKRFKVFGKENKVKLKKLFD